MIGLGITLMAMEEVDRINKMRLTHNLKPITLPEFFENVRTAPKNMSWGNGGTLINHFEKQAVLESKAAAAAMEALPKGTFTDIVEGVGKKIVAPAVGAGAALEAMRRRKNEMAMKEAAEAASAPKTIPKMSGPVARTGKVAVAAYTAKQLYDWASAKMSEEEQAKEEQKK